MLVGLQPTKVKVYCDWFYLQQSKVKVYCDCFHLQQTKVKVYCDCFYSLYHTQVWYMVPASSQNFLLRLSVHCLLNVPSLCVVKTISHCDFVHSEGDIQNTICVPLEGNVGMIVSSEVYCEVQHSKGYKST